MVNSRTWKDDRVVIRCKSSTRKDFKVVCGYFKDSEAALTYLISQFDPNVLRKGKGDLL